VNRWAALAALARQALEGNERAVLAHLAAVEGSHYRRPGARMVLTENGRSAGMLSGGCLEADIVRRLPDITEAGALRIEYDLRASEDSVWGLGLGCNGRVSILATRVSDAVATRLESISALFHRGESFCLATVVGPAGRKRGRLGQQWILREREAPPAAAPEESILIERVAPPVLLLVCGTGPDALPLAALGKSLGWSVEVVAPRAPAPAAARLADLGLSFHSPGELPTLTRGARVAAVIMTHNFFDDLSLLERLSRLPLDYLGVLGPADRTRRLVARLALETREGAPRLPDILHAPAGLDLGAETPEEIALAIAGEIQAVLAGREGGFLRRLSGPIHERTAGETS
jgi:xanthine dehydrogenase accessory factor